jgi:ABC-2 type transport system permease protein
MILLFTAIFATITIIEDRREGFLQSVLVAPAPRWAMVLGKILGGSAIALLQGTAFLLLALTLDVHLSFAAVSATIAFMALIAVALTGLGFLIAWKMDSTAGFHAIMSVVLFPMWLLSGAFFPVPPAGSDSWIEAAMAWLMRLNPLTYGVAGLRRLFYWSSETPLPADLPGLGLSIGVTFAFAAVMLWACWKISAQRISGDLL